MSTSDFESPSHTAAPDPRPAAASVDHPRFEPPDRTEPGPPQPGQSGPARPSSRPAGADRESAHAVDAPADPAAAVSPDSGAEIELDARTRNRLLRAAVHVFDRKGYAAASVREIVELAGVTKPALYYHFGSKEQLLVAILNQAARQFGATLTSVAERQGSTRQRLIWFAEALYAMYTEHVPLIRVAHSAFSGPCGAAAGFDFTLFDRSARAAMRRIVNDGLAAGEVRSASPDDVALAVSGVVESCAARQLHPGFEPIAAARLRGLLELIFDGVLTEPRAQGVHIS